MTWNWKEDGIPNPDAKEIGRVLKDSEVLHTFGEHHSGGSFVSIRRTCQEITAPGQQDQFRKVVMGYANVITHDFGTIPTPR